MRPLRTSRIGVKLVLAVVAILVVQVGVLAWVEFKADARHCRQTFLEAGRVHALSVAQGAEYGLLIGDARELRRVAEAQETVRLGAAALVTTPRRSTDARRAANACPP